MTSMTSVVYGDGQIIICGGSMRIGSFAHAWPEVMWPEEALFGSMFCASASGSCAISALVGLFHRKWQSHVNGRGPVRPYLFPVLFVSRTFGFPYLFPLFFSRTFFPVFPPFFPRTFSYRTIFFTYYFPVLFFFVLFSRTFIPYFYPVLLSRIFFLPYYFVPVLFQKSRGLKSNVLKYQWVVFLVHVL